MPNSLAQKWMIMSQNDVAHSIQFIVVLARFVYTQVNQMFVMTHTGQKKALKALLCYSKETASQTSVTKTLLYVCFNLLCVIICFVAEDIIYYVITT